LIRRNIQLADVPALATYNQVMSRRHKSPQRLHASAKINSTALGAVNNRGKDSSFSTGDEVVSTQNNQMMRIF
jgi:hypothetical protein